MSAEASVPGPPRLPANPERAHTSRKPNSRHPSHVTAEGTGKKRKRPPPLPPKPNSSTPASRPGGTTATHPHLPLKTLQGAVTKRTDAKKNGFGRETIFVNRSTGLGTYIGRSRSLVVDEGYTHLRLYALGASIPHALLLLHAVLDILPYPRGPRGLWYELRTGSVECVDDVEDSAVGATNKMGSKKGKGKQKGNEPRTENIPQALAGGDGISVKPTTTATGDVGGEDDPVQSWLQGIGGIEESSPKQEKRTKIDIYIGPKPSDQKVAPRKEHTLSKPGEGRARPNKKKRHALAAQRKGATTDEKSPGAADGAKSTGDDYGMTEEDMMNAQAPLVGARGDEAGEDEEEVVEEVEMR